MRLHKCRKVENYLIKENLIDERRIWCYAQMKAHAFSLNAFGLVLICVNDGKLFIYNAEYNSTELELFYSCSICDIQNVSIKKKLLSTSLSFVNGEDSFRLVMDDWKRFSNIFVGEV